MLRSLQKRSLFVSLLVILSMVLAACDSGGATPTPTAPAASELTKAPEGDATATTEPTKAPDTGAGPKMADPNTLIYTVAGEIETLDPAWAYDTASGGIIFNVYETLLFMKKDKADEFVPMLAEKMPEITNDGKTYTFQIRKGVKFHEGQDMTPEDVAYSFWRALIQDRSGGPQWIMLQPFFGLDVGSFAEDIVKKQNGDDWVKACEAVKQTVTFDNTAGTVTMNLKQPYGPFQQILTGSWASIVSKSWVTEQKGWDGDCANAQKFHDPEVQADELFKAMNGTGPFKLERWASTEEVSLLRNDNYWLKEPLWEGGPSGPAKVERVVEKFVDEWSTRFSSFQAGDADIAYVDRQYTVQVEPFVKETCEFGKDCAATNPTGYLRVFTKLPTVANGTILFNQAVNTTGGNTRLGSGKLDGQGIPPNFFSDVHIRKAFAYAFDWDTFIKDIYLNEAEQSLGPIINGVLGYDPGQAHYSLDLKKAEEEFKASIIKSDDGKSVWDAGFTIQYVHNEGNDQRKTAGEILKENLSQINPNFKIEVSAEPWPAFLKDTNDGRLGVFFLGWQEDFHDPHNWVTPYMSSSGTYSAQQSFDKDLQAKIDDLITKGVSATDPAERATIYKELQNMAYENALDIFVTQPQGRHWEHTWVNGWYYNPIHPDIYFYPISKGK